MAKIIDSPCVGVCQLSGQLCVGCGRSIDEITQWQKMPRPQKMAAIKKAQQRLKKINKK